MLQVCGNNPILTTKEIKKKNKEQCKRTSTRQTINYPLLNTILHAFTKGTGAFRLRILGGRVSQSFAVEYSND